MNTTNFTIDITNTLSKFSEFFGNSERMILSAKFGDGKTYLLNKFIEQDDKQNPKYYFVVLHPVNYVVEENRDIFEYIKRDILFQLLQDDKLLDTEGTLDKIVKAVSENISIGEVWDFLLSLVHIPELKSVGKLIEKCAVKVSKIRKSYQENQLMPYNYVNSFALKTGSIAECDGFTQLIQKTLDIIEQTRQCKTVLIIEDMDRLDPGHLFRILNVLGAQIDNPYFLSDTENAGEERNPNKFGFSKILLVMDYSTSKHIFHHFYGNEAEYEGYMQKFLDNRPFIFSLRAEAQKMLREKIMEVCHIDNNFFGKELKNCFNSGATPTIIDYITKQSVRRCKQLVLQEIDKFIRKDENSMKFLRTLRILVYIKLIAPADITLRQIYHSFGSDIVSFIDVIFPVYRTVLNSRINDYTIKSGNRSINYDYDEETQKSTDRETTNYIQQPLNNSYIQSAWSKHEVNVLSYIDFD